MSSCLRARSPSDPSRWSRDHATPVSPVMLVGFAMQCHVHLDVHQPRKVLADVARALESLKHHIFFSAFCMNLGAEHPWWLQLGHLQQSLLWLSLSCSRLLAPSTEPPPYPPQGIVPASCALSCAIDTKHRLGSDACVFCCISCFSMTAWRSPRALAPASIAIQTLVVRLTSDMVVQQAWNHGLGARRASFRASLDFIFLRSMKYRCVDAPPPHQNAASMNAPRQHQHSARQGSPS